MKDSGCRPPLKEHLSNYGGQIVNNLFEIVHEISKRQIRPRLLFSKFSCDDCHAWTWVVKRRKKNAMTILTRDHRRCLSSLLVKVENKHFMGSDRQSLWDQHFRCLQSFHSVLSALDLAITADFLGTDSCSRQEAIAHNTVFTDLLWRSCDHYFGWDTYLYIENFQSSIIKISYIPAREDIGEVHGYHFS